MSEFEDFSNEQEQYMMSQIVDDTAETLNENNDNNNDSSNDDYDNMIPQEEISSISAKIIKLENQMTDVENQITCMRSDIQNLDDKVSSISGDIMFHLDEKVSSMSSEIMFNMEKLISNLLEKNRPVSPPSQAVPTVQQPTIIPAIAMKESVGAKTIIPIVAAQPTTKQSAVLGQPVIQQMSAPTARIQPKQGAKGTPAPTNVTQRSSYAGKSNVSYQNPSTPVHPKTSVKPINQRLSVGSNILMSPSFHNNNQPATPTIQSTPAGKPPEPVIQESTSVQLSSVIANTGIPFIALPPTFPPGVNPSARTQEALEKEKVGRQNIVGPTLDPQHLRVHKVPGDNVILATDPTCLTFMKLMSDVNYFRKQYEQSTPIAMFISKKVLEKMFEKEATRQSPLYHLIGFVESMSGQDDDTILQLLANAILPINKNAHANIIASIAQHPEYSLKDILFNPVGYHVHTFGRVNKFLEVMLKVNRLLNFNIRDENRLRLLEEGYSKEKPPIGVVNYIMRGMKPLDANFTAIMKFENVKKFQSIENFIQALKDVNGNLAKESQDIQLKKEKSIPMKEQETIFQEASRKRDTGETAKEKVSKEPEASGKKNFYFRNSKSKNFGKGRVAMASGNGDEEMSTEEESNADEQDSSSSENDEIDADSDNDNLEVKEQKYRRVLEDSVVKDENGNEYYPSKHVINYVNKGSSDSKLKKVDTKTQPCYHQMKTPPSCPEGDKCVYSHDVSVVGKRMDDDIVRNMNHPIYKQYKAMQVRSKAFVKKVEQSPPLGPTVLKQQPTIRILSAPGSAPSQSPRNYNPATSSKIQYAQPPGNTSEPLDEVWG